MAKSAFPILVVSVSDRVPGGMWAPDVAAPPAFQTLDEIKPPRVHVAREAVFQRVVCAFLNKVLMQPAWFTAICHENELTDNARARAKARGVKAGVFDLLVFQAPRLACAIELKWGSNTPSDAQKHTADELWKCGIPRGFAWSMADVLRTLRDAGMTLHGNADNLCVEYQYRAEAAIAKAETNKGKARGSVRPRARKASPGQMARVTAARLGI